MPPPSSSSLLPLATMPSFGGDDVICVRGNDGRWIRVHIDAKLTWARGRFEGASSSRTSDAPRPRRYQYRLVTGDWDSHSVRGIAAVMTAVAKGDLSKQIDAALGLRMMHLD
ncbi:hypothetical protein DFH08DRAFT_1080958 [Mycena albidolilacea]|uniref:Uncharacterized protein n=1 Tax=Mycena albidolilacea TaxID=1033008 RepID=A0AAD7A1F3_9AGAR|nr:hypothetical protein DFH08DRAFT_1080958 [Mycena albidolilacea]